MPLRTSLPLLLCALLLPSAVSLGAPTLEVPSTSDTGHFSVQWGSEAGTEEFELQQATSVGFDDAVTLYQGTDKATTISGLMDGTYFFRVRTGQEAWSQPVQVTVLHHSLAKALFFLGVGALVFVATAGLIIGGHRAHARERAGGGEA